MSQFCAKIVSDGGLRSVIIIERNRERARLAAQRLLKRDEVLYEVKAIRWDSENTQ